jgi:hypothetical protein
MEKRSSNVVINGADLGRQARTPNESDYSAVEREAWRQRGEGDLGACSHGGGASGDRVDPGED